MNNENHVHIQIEDAEGPLKVEVLFEDTITSLLERLRAQHPHAIQDIAVFAVFAEDAETACNKEARFHECHPHRPKILHLHRCREVKVGVFYNGEESHHFRPNARIRHVLEWAQDKFQVDSSRKWVLRTGSAEGDILDPDTHIGKLAKHTHYHVELFLTERCLIQG